MYYCGEKKKMNEKDKMVNGDIVRYLLERSANKDLKDKKQRTVRDLIKKNENKVILEQLLDEVKPVKI